MISQCLTLVLWGWFNNLCGTIQWDAFIFNGTIASMGCQYNNSELLPELRQKEWRWRKRRRWQRNRFGRRPSSQQSRRTATSTKREWSGPSWVFQTPFLWCVGLYRPHPKAPPSLPSASASHRRAFLKGGKTNFSLSFNFQQGVEERVNRHI